ncbi:MAG: DMT family transporter [Clostridia bacterium]|nr:DMT family transporter [Clostridia bacterium]
MNRKIQSAGMIAGMIIAWSVYYAVSKYLVDGTGSAFLAGFLLRSAALVFLTVQIFLDGGYRRLFRQGRTVWFLILIGVLGFLLDLFANLGYAGGSLATGTALLKTDVLMVNILTVVIYRQRLYASDWIGSIVMLAGVLLVLGIDPSGIEFHFTDIFFILSALCVTANAFLIKHVQKKRNGDTDSISYYNNFVVLVLFAVCTLARGDLANIGSLDIPGLWPLVMLGGFAQTMIYFFYYRNLKRHEVWIVKLWLLLMPVVSCFIGIFFLGERMTWLKALGIGIVLAGAAVILLRERFHPESR